MFFSLILENAAGDKIDMTATANQYMTSQIEGLSPPPETISTSSYAGMDGSYLNNAFIEKRNTASGSILRRGVWTVSAAMSISISATRIIRP